MDMDKLKRVFNVCSAECSSRQEFLTILMHLTSAALEQEIKALRLQPPKDTEYVTGYLVKITQMLDGKFDIDSRKVSGSGRRP